jgi:hypothetical protein
MPALHMLGEHRVKHVTSCASERALKDNAHTAPCSWDACLAMMLVGGAKGIFLRPGYGGWIRHYDMQ